MVDTLIIFIELVVSLIKLCPLNISSSLYVSHTSMKVLKILSYYLMALFSSVLKRGCEKFYQVYKHIHMCIDVHIYMQTYIER